MNKFLNSIVIALLGIIVGVLLAFTAIRILSPIGGTERVIDVDYNDWRKLNVILSEVQKHYVDSIDMSAMTDAAVNSALAELDPHSMYLPPVELEKTQTQLADNFEGIGITFNVPNDTAIILSVIKGGPSEKAGLLQGDRLIKVDDKQIAGNKTHQDSMVRYMKGPSGTKVDILVKRNENLIPFNLTRAKIPIHCVDAAFMVNDTTGYIKLSKFSRSTYVEVSEAADNLLKEGMKRLIFDLRSNAGGYFDQAYHLSNLFLNEGEGVVYMEGRNRERSSYNSDGTGFLKDVELSVLIDEGSASSSEIFAGAIQDNDRGVIVGRRSFGKGLVQEPINFTDGSGIRLTVARFYTPSGRCIQKPYTKDDLSYAYDLYTRYEHGELTSADSIKVDTTAVYYTKSGRKVYGGGGIIPDIFVPMDTTRATKFFINCNKKATMMRFASSIFDSHKSSLSAIDNFDELQSYVFSLNLEKRFLDFASRKDNLSPKGKEWDECKIYMMPQIYGLVGRYSLLGEEAFYRFYMDLDETIQAALNSSSQVDLIEQ